MGIGYGAYGRVQCLAAVYKKVVLWLVVQQDVARAFFDNLSSDNDAHTVNSGCLDSN